MCADVIDLNDSRINSSSLPITRWHSSVIHNSQSSNIGCSSVVPLKESACVIIQSHVGLIAVFARGLLWCCHTGAAHHNSSLQTLWLIDNNPSSPISHYQPANYTTNHRGLMRRSSNTAISESLIQRRRESGENQRKFDSSLLMKLWRQVQIQYLDKFKDCNTCNNKKIFKCYFVLRRYEY